MLTVENIIENLKRYWKEQNCLIVESYDLEMGAGTFHKKTTLDTLYYYHKKKPWKVAYVQPSRRPSDSRFGAHPNRVNKFHQFQVIIMPIPTNAQELYLNSLKVLDIDISKYDIKFIEDDWSSPTLGASGIGYEVRINGMEIGQFTYFQKLCSAPVYCLEITYGIERTALFIQNKENINQLQWSEDYTWEEVFVKEEQQMSELYINHMPTDMLISHFNDYKQLSKNLLEQNLAVPAYEFCIKMSNCFNILDSRKAISHQERETYIQQIRHIAQKSGEKFLLE